jgi:hypothetical protein
VLNKICCLIVGYEESSAEWGARRCSPQRGLAELGGIKLGQNETYNRLRASTMTFFKVSDFAQSVLRRRS